MREYDHRDRIRQRRIAEEEISQMEEQLNIEREEDSRFIGKGYLGLLMHINFPLYLTNLFRPRVTCPKFNGIVLN